MIIAEVAGICLGGGVGAALRFVLDGVIRRHIPSSLPLGTMIINLTGSLVLGLIVGAALGQVLSPHWQLVLGTGVMGGYTTFSTASVESIRLLEERRWVATMISSFGMLIVCTLGAALGLLVGTRL